MEIHNPLKRLSFTGKGGDLFVVLLVNWLLTAVTLGLYYPWAKVRKLGWYYGNTTLDGHPFHFHGTGREMFRGFIKAVGLMLLIYGPYVYVNMSHDFQWLWPALGILMIGSLFFIPLAIHGTYRYRASRSSWRGIHFGYRGELKELYTICIRDGLLTLITFGIYGSWFTMNLRNYLINHLRYGSSQFRYKGDGLEYFVMNLKGMFLSVITLYIYLFWWQRDRFNYYVDNLSWEFADGRRIQFRSTATGGGMFGLLVGNILIVALTLGLGLAWAEVRTMRFVMENIDFQGDADLNSVVQTEQEHKNALGDDLGDMMDIGVIF